MDNRNLIFDIGTSEGNDSAFYLAKGFDVVAVEADPVTFAAYVERFKAEIAAGRLVALNRAAAATSGEPLTFWRNDKDQGVSSLFRSSKDRYTETQSSHTVTSIAWADLVTIKGVPHYAKIDIEGAEVDFLSGVIDRPAYLSAEAKKVDIVTVLAKLGYDRFRIIDQKAIRGFKLPNPALEGRFVNSNNSDHGSGLFGEELPGRTWLSSGRAADVLGALLEMQREGTILHSWYDVHAFRG